MSTAGAGHVGAAVGLFPPCVAFWTRANLHRVFQEVECRHLLGEPLVLFHLRTRGGLMWLGLARGAKTLVTDTSHTSNMMMVQHCHRATSWFGTRGEEGVGGQQVCHPLALQGLQQLLSSQPGQVNSVKSGLAEVCWTYGRGTRDRCKPAPPAGLAECVSTCVLMERRHGKTDTALIEVAQSCVS